VGDEGSEGAQSQEPKDYDFWASHLQLSGETLLRRFSSDLTGPLTLVASRRVEGGNRLTRTWSVLALSGKCESGMILIADALR
jgi:hypothetical protein